MKRNRPETEWLSWAKEKAREADEKSKNAPRCYRVVNNATLIFDYSIDRKGA